MGGYIRRLGGRLLNACEKNIVALRTFTLIVFVLLSFGFATYAVAQDTDQAPADGNSKLEPEQQKQLEEAGRLIAQAEELVGQKRFSEAIPLAKRVLTIRQQVLGKEHPDYLKG